MCIFVKNIINIPSIFVHEFNKNLYIYLDIYMKEVKSKIVNEQWLSFVHTYDRMYVYIFLHTNNSLAP